MTVKNYWVANVRIRFSYIHARGEMDFLLNLYIYNHKEKREIVFLANLSRSFGGKNGCIYEL